MATKRVTILEFFEAMEKDAFPKATGQLVRRNAEGAIIQACAYGQAALHLGVVPQSLFDRIKEWGRNHGLNVLSQLVNTNDETDSTVPAIARYYRTQIPVTLLNSSVEVTIAEGHE